MPIPLQAFTPGSQLAADIQLANQAESVIARAGMDPSGIMQNIVAAIQNGDEKGYAAHVGNLQAMAQTAQATQAEASQKEEALASAISNLNALGGVAKEAGVSVDDSLIQSIQEQAKSGNLSGATETARVASGLVAQRLKPEALAAAEKQAEEKREKVLTMRDTWGSMKLLSDNIQELQSHDGFEGLFGFGVGMRHIPGTDSNAAQGLFDSIKGGAFLEAVQKMRGLGTLTEREGAKAEASFLPLSESTNEEEARKRLTSVQQRVQEAMRNVEDEMARTDEGQVVLQGLRAPSKARAATQDSSTGRVTSAAIRDRIFPAAAPAAPAN